MPVPVAESQTRLNRASSGLGCGTTGAVRTTARCSPGTSHPGVVVLSAFFTGGSPHANTNPVSSTHGTQADSTARRVSGSAVGASGAADSSGYRHVSAGRQSRNSTVSATSDVSPATTSTSDGPWKFETRNCTAANVPPQTSTAGQTPTTPRRPAITQTIHAGTSREKNGSCRPAIALSFLSSSP